MRHSFAASLLAAVVCLSVVQVGAAPSAPGSLTAVVTGDQVALTWVPPPGAALTGYRLEAGMAPGLSNAANLLVGTTPAFNTSAVPNGVYYVRVRAVAADGESAPSNEAIVVVGGTSPCMSVPPAPVNLRTTVNGSLVELAWTNAGCAPSNYLVFAGSSPGAGDIATLNAGNVLGLTATAPNGTYYVYVAAQNAYGISPPSNVVTVQVGGTGGGAGLEVDLATASIGATAAGDTVLLGEVTNRTSEMVIFTKITGALQNASGTTLGSAFTYLKGVSRQVGSVSPAVTDTTLAPGESGCFYLTLPVSRASVSRVSFSVEADRAAARTLSGRPEVVGAPAFSVDSGRVRVEGQVRNNGSVLTYFNRAVFYVRRSDSVALGCDFEYVSGSAVTVEGTTTNTALAPAQSGPFARTTHATVPAANVNVWTHWAEGGATAADARASAAMADLAADGESGRGRARRLWEALEAAREQAYRAQKP